MGAGLRADLTVYLLLIPMEEKVEILLFTLEGGQAGQSLQERQVRQTLEAEDLAVVTTGYLMVQERQGRQVSLLSTSTNERKKKENLSYEYSRTDDKEENNEDNPCKKIK